MQRRAQEFRARARDPRGPIPYKFGNKPIIMNDLHFATSLPQHCKATSAVVYLPAPLAISPEVEKPSTVGTIFTCPPQLSTSFAPTTVSGL